MAVKDCWLFGDTFLFHNYHALPKMKTEALAFGKKKIPYLYDYYNINCFTSSPQSLTKDILARFVNCVIKALNNAVKMPHTILMIPEWDILNYINHECYGVRTMSHAALFWIVNQICRAIEVKKDEFSQKKLGSIMAMEPRVFSLQIFNLGFTPDDREIAFKFNSMLKEVLAEHDNHFLMNISECMDADEMYAEGSILLNDYGKNRMWLEINKLMELLDKDKISLRPKKMQKEKDQHQSTPKSSGHNQHQHQCYHHGNFNSGDIMLVTMHLVVDTAELVAAMVAEETTTS